MYTIKQTPEDFKVEEIPDYKENPQGEYTIYKLTKIDTNSETALQTIAQTLNIPRKAIGVAGYKDKKAVTKQYISIHNGPNQKVKQGQIAVEPVGKAEHPITLGNLKGNKFIINVYTEDEPKEKKIFLNLFGEQRFQKNNAEIGKYFLRKDFKKVCELIIENGGDQKSRLEQKLKKNATDFVGALKAIPKKILLFYIHSYQSKLWNELAEQYPTKLKLPLVGFGTEVDELLKPLLEKEQIQPRDFIIRQFPEVTAEGTDRNVSITVDITKEKIDNGYKLTFQLPPGSYATEIIRQLFE